MDKNYSTPYHFIENAWNNRFAWEKRKALYNTNPCLIIPSRKVGKIEDVKIGDTLVFEEEEDGILKSCSGLENFISIEGDIPIQVFDNHNHALYFWIEALRNGYVKKGFELIHIDEHSDLWENKHSLDIEKALLDEAYTWEFTNFSCNVWNYIEPIRQTGYIEKIVRIENEYQIDTYKNYTPEKNSILNLDLDIFAPELDHIDEMKKVACIKNFLPKVSYVTIATSPFFIEQERALEKLRKVFEN